MGKKGIGQVELLMWLVGGFMAVLGYVHMNFATYREVSSNFDQINKRFDSVETLIRNIK